MKKYIIVGGVAGGASAAARLRRIDENAEIIMFERGPHVSFSNCCLPYRLSNQIKEHDDLVLMDSAKFHKQFNISARVNSEVIAIDRNAKTVTVKEVSGKEYTESYDKLILSPGANAVIPPIEGIDKANIFIVKNVVDIAALYDFINGENNVKKITVVGGGFIGIETAENLCNAGFEVTLVEAADQIMQPFDYDMVQILNREIMDQGIRLLVNNKVVKFNKNNVILDSGTEVEGDAVVMAIGVKPDSSLAVSAGIEVNKTGHIKVTPNWQTITDKNIYAVGDAVEVFNAITHKAMVLPLAGPAQKQARQAGNHIYGVPSNNTGYIGSSSIKVFDYNGASTGLNENQCKAEGLLYDISYIIYNDKVSIMPNAYPVFFKLIYEIPTGRVLGAQAISKGDAVKRIDVIATLIKFNGTVYDLTDLELCYAPPVSTAKDVTNMAGYVAVNLLNGAFKQVRTSEVRELIKKGAYIVDVREKHEFEHSSIKNTVNIPLSEIRQRIHEIPKNEPVYVSCFSAQRSYYAYLILQANGFDNIYTVSGGIQGLVFYEYFNDHILGREKIVTNYAVVPTKSPEKNSKN